MVVFDTSTLILALDPKARPPTDPTTNKPIERCRERIELLLAALIKQKASILIPTPVLAEYLVKAGPEKHQMLQRFTESKNFEIGYFDVKAAVELAELLGDPDLQKRNLDPQTTKAKIKFDRQIVAIAKTRGASHIYTDDDKLAAIARNNSIAAVMTWELPLPPEPPIDDLFKSIDEEKSSW